MAILGCILLIAVGSARAAEDTDIPTEAPNDSIMANPAEVQGMLNWAAAAFFGTSPNAAEKSFVEPAPPFSFRYDGVESNKLLKTWNRSVENRDEKDRVQHKVAWTDSKTGLRVTAVVTGFKRYPAVDWVLHFENTGKQDSPILENIQALDATLRTGNSKQAAILHQLTGDLIGGPMERSFLPMETALEAGKTLSMAPKGGGSSTEAFPFFNLQYVDEGVITAIGWTGHWAASLERAGAGPTRLLAGMQKTHLVLHPGERIRSPRILLMAWKDDRLAAHQRFRRLLMFHYVPKQNGRPPRLPFALEGFSRYYGKRSDWATEAGQIAGVKAASELGCDAYWLDAGWFAGGFPQGSGNWYCDPKQFPNGLKPVSDACHRLGLRFILWFEPERVVCTSQIAREHPGFVFDDKGGVGVFKLSEPAARRWLTDFLSQRITEYGIDVYRNDCCIDPFDIWRPNDAPDRQGMTEIRYVEGLYAMWDELLARHPGLLIDNCAGGGQRLDLETCMRSVTLWRSDINCAPGRADWNHTQTQGLSLYLPLFGAGSWFPKAYDLRSSATAGVACSFDYLNADFSRDQARAAIAEVKENQKYWYGDFYPLTPPSLQADQWVAYQFHREHLHAGLVLAFRRGACPSASLSVKLGGIDPAHNYVVEFIDDSRQKVRKTICGRELAAPMELQLPTKQSSLLVRYRVAPQELSP